MFNAIDVETETLTHANKALRGRNYACPGCGEQNLVIKGSQFSSIRKHFAHRPESTCSMRGESDEHLAMKLWIYECLMKQDDVRVAKVEAPLKEIGRVADVLAQYEDDVWHAWEIQKSRQGVDDFKERTKDYNSHGIEVTWIVSRSAYSDEDVAILRKLGLDVTVFWTEVEHVESEDYTIDTEDIKGSASNAVG